MYTLPSEHGITDLLPRFKTPWDDLLERLTGALRRGDNSPLLATERKRAMSLPFMECFTIACSGLDVGCTRLRTRELMSDCMIAS